MLQSGKWRFKEGFLGSFKCISRVTVTPPGVAHVTLIRVIGRCLCERFPALGGFHGLVQGKRRAALAGPSADVLPVR